MTEQSVTVGEFLAEVEVVLCQIDPDLDWKRSDLSGFVRGCWPTESSPADVACDFANAVRSQQESEI